MGTMLGWPAASADALLAADLRGHHVALDLCTLDAVLLLIQGCLQHLDRHRLLRGGAPALEHAAEAALAQRQACLDDAE